MMKRVVGKVMAWLPIAITVLLVAPAVASAVFRLHGKTSQGLSVRLRVSNNLSTIKRFAIDWRAQCTSGAVLLDGSVGGARVTPFPHFHSNGSYMTTNVNYSAAQPGLTFDISVDLHGKLVRNGRARGTWTGTARVLDSNQNQIDSCTTGSVSWSAGF